MDINPNPLNQTIKARCNLMLPQLYVPPKQKYNKNKNLITEPTLAEELQPWDQS